MNNFGIAKTMGPLRNRQCSLHYETDFGTGAEEMNLGVRLTKVDLKMAVVVALAFFPDREELIAEHTTGLGHGTWKT